MIQIVFLIIAPWIYPTHGEITELASGRSWYVTRGSANANASTCDSPKSPCGDLTDVLPFIEGDDLIYLDNAGNVDHVFDLCGDQMMDGVHHLDKSVRILGVGSMPKVSCIDDQKLKNNTNATLGFTVLRHETAANETCKLVLSHVTILDTVLSFSNCTVEINDVVFVNASVVSRAPCEFVYMTIIESEWYGSQRCTKDGACLNNFLNNITCSFTKLTLSGNKFYQTNFAVEQPHLETGTVDILVKDSIFTNLPSEIQFLGGLHFTFLSNNSQVLVENCTFRKLINPTRVQSVINLYDAAIWVKATARQAEGLPDPLNAAEVVIKDCTFFDNERGLSVVGTYRTLTVSNSLFEQNMAMHAGAGILVLINPHSGGSELVVNECTFIANVAGNYRQNYPIKEKVGAFEIIDKEVHLNADCCKGVVMMVGKGGAIRAQRGKVRFTNCSFVNNSAKLLGGSIMVDIDGDIKIFNTKFTIGATHKHALQGDILYSDGQAKIAFVDIIIGKSTNGLSIFRHSGNHWTLDITNIWIQCPTGYNLRTTNSSAYGVHDQGLRRSFLLDQLSYFCESCPRNKYSLDNGTLNYTMVFNDWTYFTLLINGSEPVPQYTGKYIHHEIECNDCPYGGHCVHGITSVANFWGYINEKAVSFQHCPRGYCCSSMTCPSINACVDKRHGRLCGRCIAGYSEALFSPSCVPNETCGRYWLWPLGVSIGIFYTMFLLFQTDMKNFLFSNDFFCSRLIRQSKEQKQRRRSPVMNGNVAAAMRLAERSKFLVTPEMEQKTPNGTHVDPPQKETEDFSEFKASDSGLLIIMFYYFQDALLLHVKTVYASSESRTQQLMKSILSGLFKLQLDLFELIEEVCTVPNMTPVPNVITKAFIVPYVICMFLLTYGIYKWIQIMRGKDCRNGQSRAEQSKTELTVKKSFISRLASGFILALLFTYQKLGTTTFTLLNCVPVEGELALFIDGTISCYQYWQYAVMAYAMSCVVPFFIVLMVGPSLLYKGIISLPEFFLACLCPTLFLVPWIVKRVNRTAQQIRTKKHLGEGTHAVIQVLQGPFKENKYGVCWAGVLIGRRLVLVLLFTFVNDSLIRLLGMLLACFTILLHHVHVQPYKDLRGNLAGTASATALVTLASINLVRAGFEAAEYTPTGPNAFLMRIFVEIENTLLLWLPFCIMCIVTLFFLGRLLGVLYKCACKKKRKHEAGDSHIEDNINGTL